MIVKMLVENTSHSDELNCEHGLSLYIETRKHKLLFDVGASALFAENAKKLNVDLSEVDLVIISHGHYDHGGGLKEFFKVNSKAKVYLHKKAFEKHFANKPTGEKSFIGLDERLMSNDRFIFTDGYLAIDEQLELFSNIKSSKFNLSGNQDLLMERGSLLIQDDFAHEQNLIIGEDGISLLLAGCAHTGIVNIMNHFYAMKDIFPNHVIGGFHLYNRSRNVNEDPGMVMKIGNYLNNTNSKFYTCHCTGIESFKILKETMGENIEYLATGSQLIL